MNSANKTRTTATTKPKSHFPCPVAPEHGLESLGLSLLSSMSLGQLGSGVHGKEKSSLGNTVPFIYSQGEKSSEWKLIGYKTGKRFLFLFIQKCKG